ncbi:MAG: XdhC/CoxI family protein [Chloroflexota bacterium]|jgi:xanthine dehydrogenase accessory factor|nr:XdhC/CoxI family protein [Dehalococcoidia bacterium]MDW8047021.1 XdhC/CoxI family protein [Chloroflexota bacterium]
MLELTRRIAEAAEGGEPVLVAMVLEPGPRAQLRPGARLAITRSGERLGSLGDPELDDLVAAEAPAMFAEHAVGTVYVAPVGLSWRTVPGATSLYIEVVEPKPVLLVVGAGHIGRALAKLGNFLGFHVAVIDDREEFADPAVLPEADEVICAEYGPALDAYPIGPATHVVLVTRGHKHDEEALRHCVGRGARYLGMIGSKRRTSTVLEHLLADGFDPEELAKVRTPIGLDIGAETPEEIAVAIMAEIILVRRGGTGAPMYWRPAHLRQPVRTP